MNDFVRILYLIPIRMYIVHRLSQKTNVNNHSLYLYSTTHGYCKYSAICRALCPINLLWSLWWIEIVKRLNFCLLYCTSTVNDVNDVIVACNRSFTATSSNHFIIDPSSIVGMVKKVVTDDILFYNCIILSIGG